MTTRGVVGALIASSLVGTYAAADTGWVVLKISVVQAKPTKIDGKPWDLPNDKVGDGCGFIGALVKVVKVVASAAGPPGAAVATIASVLCSHSSRPQQQRDPSAPDLFVKVVAGDAVYRTPVALDTFAEAFDFPLVIPLNGIPAAGLELQVLDQDEVIGAGELIGMVRLTRKQVADTLVAASPILTLSDSQLDKIEVEIGAYAPPSPMAPFPFDVKQEPVSLHVKARAGELVTIVARGKYSVADNHEQIDENGYAGGKKRGYNRKEFPQANHATAIAYFGAPIESHTAIVVGSCTTAVTPTGGDIYVGVNDSSVGNNLGTIELGADLRRRQKPDRFREVGFGRAVRIDRERVAFAA